MTAVDDLEEKSPVRGDRSRRVRRLTSVVALPDGTGPTDGSRGGCRRAGPHAPLDDHVDHDDQPRLPAGEVSRLLEIAHGEAAVIDTLDACLAQLRDAQDAKATLAQLPAADLRFALELRRRSLDQAIPGSATTGATTGPNAGTRMRATPGMAAVRVIGAPVPPHGGEVSA